MVPRTNKMSRRSAARCSRTRRRCLLLEPLAVRRLLAGDWQNPFNRGDVNDDGRVAPIDALIVINRINSQGAGPLPIPPPSPGGPPPFVDTSGDDSLTAVDPLIIFNVLNSDRSPPELTVALANDTAQGGGTNTDLITADASTAGNVRDLSGISSLVFVDGSVRTPVPFDFRSGDFSFDPGFASDGSDDGEHRLLLEAVDARGNGPTQTELLITLDTQPPQIEFGLVNDTAAGGGTNADRITSDPSVAGRITDLAGVAVFRAELNGNNLGDVSFDAQGNFAVNHGLATDGSDDGEHLIEYLATDLAGNTATATLSFTLDTQAPQIAAALLNDTAPRNTTNNDGVTLDARLAGNVATATANIVSFQARLDVAPAVNVPLDGGNNFVFDPGLQPGGNDDGAHSVRFTVVDQAGNTSFRDVAFTLDTVAPGPTTLFLDPAFVFGPPADGLTRDANVSLLGTADPLSLVELQPTSRDTVANGTGVFRFDNVPLQLGENALAVTAFDVAGNQSGIGRSFTRVEPDIVARLQERDRFATEMSVLIDLDLAAGSRQVRFDVEAEFDRSDTTSVGRDAFMVYLVNPDSRQQVLLSSGSPGTALFALREGSVEFRPGLVNFDGRTVEIEVSQLGHLDQGRLVFQLINNDTDSNTRVVVRRLVNEVDPEGVVSPIFPPPPSLSSQGVGLAGINAFSVNPTIDVQLSNARFQPETGRYLAELRVANSGFATDRRVAVVFPGLPAGVTLANAAGTTAAGAPYLDLSQAIGSGGLANGAVSQGILVQFNVATPNRFPLNPQVLSGSVNRPPVFSLPANLQVFPGGYLQQTLDANDPDGDRVTYAVRSNGPLPSYQLRADGMFVVTPGPADVGTYEVTLTASDGVLETSQQVTLQVPMDPVTTTRVEGQVLDVEMNPLAGVPIELGGDSTTTNAQGMFLLELSVPMPQRPLEVHGEQLVGPDDFPFVAEDLALLLNRPFFSGVNNVLPRPIFLPKLDSENATTIDPFNDTLVSTPIIPDASLLVIAGSLGDLQGQMFAGEVSITEVPRDLTPAALPPEQAPDMLVTIQPAELNFTTPAPLQLPNTAGYAPGTEMDLFSINPQTGQFDIVGSGQVSSDGQSVETVTGGVRNSSWHFFSPRPTLPTDLATNVRNPLNCNNCQERIDANAQVELHSGVMLEEHALVAYQTMGVTRNLRLVYDSLRADPRPILHFGYDAVPDDGTLRLVANLSVRGDGLEVQVPGRPSQDVGLTGNEQFWSIPAGGGDIEAALQADLSRQSTGHYRYQLLSGLLRLQDGVFNGSRVTSTADLLHVNSIDSVFGAGWGLAGLQQLHEGSDGSVLLVDGDGSEWLYLPADTAGNYVAPAGDFSRLEKLGDATFRRTLKDQTVYSFDASNRLESIVDRHGNQTAFAYDASSNLLTITDPVGEVTSFAYTGGKVSGITDPAGRTTMLMHDGEGNLTSVHDPDTSQRSFDYDDHHLLIAETNKRGFRETSVFDFAGRLERSVTEDEAEIQVEPLQVQFLLPADATLDPLNAPAAFAKSAPLAFHTDAIGNTFATELDQYGQRVFSYDGEGSRERIQRNAQNLITSITDPRGFTTRYTYDARGNLVSIFDAGLSGGRSLDNPFDLGILQTSRSLQAHVGSLDLVDFYRLELESPSRLRIGLIDLFENATVSIVADLDGDFRVDANEIVESATSSSTDPLVITEDLSAGVWYIRVEPATFPAGENTSYTLDLSAVPLVVTTPGDPAGNTLSAARDVGNLSSQQRFQDWVGSTDDRDYYRFQIGQNASPVLIRLSELRENADLQLIRDANNNGTIDFGEVLATATAGGTSSEQIFATLDVGTYFVSVQPSTFPVGENTSYTLDLTVVQTPAATPHVDNGNALGMAMIFGDLTGNAAFSGSLGGSDSNDFIRFNVTQPVRLRAQLTGLSADARLGLVADIDGDLTVDSTDLIAASQRSTTAAPEWFDEEIGPGTYYLRVYQESFDSRLNTNYFVELLPEVADAIDPDPGQFYATALPIDPFTGPRTFRDSVGSFDRFDYYEFTITQASTVSARLSELEEDIELGLAADLNGNGAPDSGELIELSALGGKQDEFLVEQLAPGTYYFVVLQESFQQTENSHYRLDLDITPATTTTVSDPGEGYASALVIDPILGPQSFRESVGSLDTADYYKFTLSASATVTARLGELNEDLRLALAADINGNGAPDNGEIIEFSANSGKQPKWISEQLAPGEYYLVVLQNPFQRLENSHYLLELDVTPSLMTTAVDPGELLADALPITPTSRTQTFRENVGSLDRFDYYRFTLAESGTITAALSGLNEDVQLALVTDLDNNGTPDTIELSSNSGTSREWIDEQVPAGTYYLLVSQGDFQADQNSDYLLDVRFDAVSPTTVSEPGETLATALSIDPFNGPRSFRNTVGSLDKRDFYQFTLTAPATVTAELDVLDEDLQLGLVADLTGNGYDGADLIETSTLAGRSREWLSEELPAGTYYFVVYQGDFQPQENSHYLLNVDIESIVDVHATDPGNRPGDAVDLGMLTADTLTRDIAGTLDANDYFRFTLSSPLNVELLLRDLDENLDLGLVVDTNGNGNLDAGEQIASSARAGRSVQWIYTTLASGTYYARVNQSTFARTENSHYELHIRLPASPVSNPVDPGSTLATALSLGTLSGTIARTDFVGDADPNDYYRLTLTEPRELRISLTGLSADADLRLIADRDGDLVIDSGDVIEESNTSGTTPAFLHEDLGPGTYFIHVLQPSFPSNQNTNYNLEISSTPIDVDPMTDAGNTLGTALDLGLLSDPQAVRGIIGSLDPLDLYRIEVSRDSQVKLRLEGLVETAELTIIADENGDLTAQSSELIETAQGSHTIVLTEFLPQGVYYVQVGQVSFPVGENTRYRLVAESLPIATTTRVEPGEVLPEAMNLGTLLPGTLTGQQTLRQTVGNLDRADVYRFVLNEPNELRLQLRDLSEEVVVSLIADLDGDLSIDTGETIESVSALPTGTALLTEFLPAGTYYLSVTSNTFPIGQNSNYTLDVEVRSLAANPVGDPGNTILDALDLGPLSDELSLSEVIGTFDLNDFYRFDLASVRDVCLRLDGLQENVIVSLVADVNDNGSVDNGETLESVSSSGSEVLLNEVLGPGTYYIRIQPATFPSGENTSYNLHVASRGMGDTFGPRTFTYEDVFNQLTSEKDELGRQAIYTVDPLNGNIVRETRIVGLPDETSGETDDLITEFTYTATGRIDTITDPAGRLTDHDFDLLGRLTRITYASGTADEGARQFEYDAAGNVTAIIDENLNRTEFLPDIMNRLTQLTSADPDRAGPLASPLTQFDYDAAGNLIATTDARNQQTEFTYDLKDRPSTRTNVELNQTVFVHDLHGNLTLVGDESGAATLNRYDERNRLIESSDPNHGVTRYRYDANDNLIRVTDPAGNVTRYDYDRQNRLMLVIDPLGVETRYQYDAVGNRLATVDRNGRRTEFTYDDLDRLVRETWRDSGGFVENVIDYSYDESGNLLTAIDDSSSLTFTYDDRNRLETASNAGTAGSPLVEVTYTYDDAGNVLAIADRIAAAPAGVTSFEIDGLNRMTRITQGGSGVADKRVDLAYDALGQFLSIDRFSDLAGTKPVVATSFVYDVLNRVDSITHNNGTSDIATYDYAYDEASRVSSLTDVDGMATYEYDNSGQLTDVGHSGREDESFAYDAGGNRTQSSLHGNGYQIDAGNRLGSDGTYDYEYDDEGNVVRRTEIATGDFIQLSYDHRNRLRAVIEKDSGGVEQSRVEYRYDVLNRRIAAHRFDLDETIEYFSYDRDALHLTFADDDGGGPNEPTLDARFLNGPLVDQVLAEQQGGEVHWLLTDRLGSVRDIADNDGDVINHIVYGAFGEVVSESDSGVDTLHRFAGRELDRETGLHYFRARYYDPRLGRFLSEDPLGQAAGDTNLLSYAFNDPVNQRDSSGQIVARLSISSETLRSLAFSRFVVAGKLDVQVEQFISEPTGRIDPLSLFNRAAQSASGTAAVRHPWSPTHLRDVDLSRLTLARQSVAGGMPTSLRPLSDNSQLLRQQAARLVAPGLPRTLAQLTISAVGELRQNLAGGPGVPLGFVIDVGLLPLGFGTSSRDV